MKERKERNAHNLFHCYKNNYHQNMFHSPRNVDSRIVVIGALAESGTKGKSESLSSQLQLEGVSSDVSLHSRMTADNNNVLSNSKQLEERILDAVTTNDECLR